MTLSFVLISPEIYFFKLFSKSSLLSKIITCSLFSPKSLSRSWLYEDCERDIILTLEILLPGVSTFKRFCSKSLLLRLSLRCSPQVLLIGLSGLKLLLYFSDIIGLFLIKFTSDLFCATIFLLAVFFKLSFDIEELLELFRLAECCCERMFSCLILLL